MIIIGDIHGNFDTFMALLAKIPQEEKDKGIVISGDLEDRGLKSRQVIEYCMENEDKFQVVRGNHEEMMVNWNKSFNMGDYGDVWLWNGGLETLKEYGCDPTKKPDYDKVIFEKHVDWMRSLPYFREYPDVKNEDGKHLLVTHSSASKVWKWNNEHRKQLWNHFTYNLLWERPDIIHDIPNIYNVFGHTPLSQGPKIKKTYANIDTGCFYMKEPGKFGKLTALQFPEMIIYQQENIDDVSDRWKPDDKG